MTKFAERSKVRQLRKEGKSYSEILKIIKVSKSSLSLWLKDIPLTEDQIKRIKGNKERAIERFIETMKLKRQKRLLDYYTKQKEKWLPLSDRELFLSGLFLYWGEGNKASRNTVSVSNTDPNVIKFSILWMIRSLNVPKNKIKVSLQLYSDMNIDKSIDYWIKELNIPIEQFNKSYIKTSTRSLIDQKGFGHGTCSVSIQNTVIKENLLMAIKAIADFYSEKVKNLV
jgi:hypothetical protein